MRNFLQPEELMRNCTRFKLHRAPSKRHWSTPVKNLSPKLFGLFSPVSRPVRKIYPSCMIRLAILLFEPASYMRAQDAPKPDESQQDSEPKKDKEQGKKEEAKSEKKEEKRKK